MPNSISGLPQRTDLNQMPCVWDPNKVCHPNCKINNSSTRDGILREGRDNIPDMKEPTGQWNVDGVIDAEISLLRPHCSVANS